VLPTGWRTWPTARPSLVVVAGVVSGVVFL
jgi:hypothetical protein